MAKVTFTVTNIGGGPGGSIAVSLGVDVEGEMGAGKRHVADIALNLAREVGKEFELDDTYSLEIAPKPEGQH